jgi:tetratricopeptide (TPR) repeat protein
MAEFFKGVSERVVLKAVVEHMLNKVSPNVIRSALAAQNVDAAMVERSIAAATVWLSDEFTTCVAKGNLLMGRRWSKESRAIIVEAEANYRRALEMQPNNAEVLSLLGWSLDNQERYAEALQMYDRALAINPNEERAIKRRELVLTELTRIELEQKSAKGKQDASGSNRVLYTRFPRLIEDIANLDHAIPAHIMNHVRGDEVTILPETKVVTVGHCFARDLSCYFREENVLSNNIILFEQNNNTFANLRMFRDALVGQSSDDDAPFDPTMEQSLADVTGLLTQADLIVYSLGNSACFFNKKTGKFVPSRGAESIVGVSKGEYFFRNITVEENVQNILSIMDIVKAVNPKCKFVFLLVPAPMNSTLELRSAVDADCLSKAILRVALEQVLTLRPQECFYWPVFESIRWLGAYLPGLYGAEDATALHVSFHSTKSCVQHFVRTFRKQAHD